MIYLIYADGPTALIGLVHPMLRRIPLLLLSQIYTFSQFILGLEEPIPTPDTLATRTAAGLMPGLASIANERDPRATILAQDRVRELGLAVGVDTRLWGRGLEQLNSESSGYLVFPCLLLQSKQVSRGTT